MTDHQICTFLCYQRQSSLSLLGRCTSIRLVAGQRILAAKDQKKPLIILLNYGKVEISVSTTVQVGQTLTRGCGESLARETKPTTVPTGSCVNFLSTESLPHEGRCCPSVQRYHEGQETHRPQDTLYYL